MLNRREFLATATAASAGLIVAATLPAPVLAKQADIPAADAPSKYRGPRLVFLGGVSSAAVNRAIAAHIEAHATRQAVAIGEGAFCDEISKLGVEPVRSLSLVSVGHDVPPENSHRRLIGLLRNDPDELIFQSPATRFLGTALSGAPCDQLNWAWECGHHTTCGIVASDLEDMHSKVSAILDTFPYGVYSPQVKAIDVEFEGKDASQGFRHAFLADPSSNIYWARAA